MDEDYDFDPIGFLLRTVAYFLALWIMFDLGRLRGRQQEIAEAYELAQRRRRLAIENAILETREHLRQIVAKSAENPTT